MPCQGHHALCMSVLCDKLYLASQRHSLFHACCEWHRSINTCLLCMLHSLLPSTCSCKLLWTACGLLAANLGLAASSSILLSFTCVNTFYLDKLHVYDHILISKKVRQPQAQIKNCSVTARLFICALTHFLHACLPACSLTLMLTMASSDFAGGTGQLGWQEAG